MKGRTRFYAVAMISLDGGSYTVHEYADERGNPTTVTAILERAWVDPAQFIADLYACPVVDLRTIHNERDAYNPPRCLEIDPTASGLDITQMFAVDRDALVNWYWERGCKVTYPVLWEQPEPPSKEGWLNSYNFVAPGMIYPIRLPQSITTMDEARAWARRYLQVQRLPRTAHIWKAE